jgi:N-acetylneuraminic acid mutarotase
MKKISLVTLVSMMLAAPVALLGQVRVQIFPPKPVLPVHGIQSVTAVVSGTTNKSVTWGTTCGTLIGSGATVGLTSTTVQTCTVTATSVADSTNSASVNVVFTPAPTPNVSTHPRLLFTVSDVSRLRSWAVSTNPMWQNGVLVAINQADAYANAHWNWGYPTGGAGTSNGWQDDGSSWPLAPMEGYAGLYAFLGQIDPDPTLRDTYCSKAHELFMYIINDANGNGPNLYRADSFATYNRMNAYAQVYGTVPDWCYSKFTPTDKGTVRTVYRHWAQLILTASSSDSAEHPQPIGTVNSSGLIGTTMHNAMYAANNYSYGHLTALIWYGLALDDADDTPLFDTSQSAAYVDSSGNVNSMRAILSNALGAWLYRVYGVFEDKNIVQSAYGYSSPYFGIVSGGMSAEGPLYGMSLCTVELALYGLHTAGRDDPAVWGPQVNFLNSSYWPEHTNSWLAVATPGPWGTPVTSFGQAWGYFSYGDIQRLYFEDIDMFSYNALLDREKGDTASLQRAYWAEANLPWGGTTHYYDRAGVWATAASGNGWELAPIATFLVNDPSLNPIAAPDPRATVLPLDYSNGQQWRTIYRSDFTANASIATWLCGYQIIDHQNGNCGKVDFYRKGEWLLKAKDGYSGNYFANKPMYADTMGVVNNLAAFSAGGPGGVDYASWQQGGQLTHGNEGYPSDPNPASLGPGDLAIPNATWSISSGPAYLFAQADATPLYNTYWDQGVQANWAIWNNHVSRSMLYANKDLMAIYDREETTGHNTAKQEWWGFTYAPTISGNTLSVTSTANGQKMWLDTVLPASGVTYSTITSWDNDTWADKDPVVAIVNVSAGTPQTTRFLHVMQATDSGGSRIAPTLVQSTAGEPYDGAVVGTSLMLFKHTMSDTVSGVTYPASGATTHYVSGLTANTSYSITGTGTPSSATTDNAGVLMFSAAGTGSIAIGTPTPTIIGIVVAPSSASIAIGGSQQFTATCNYSDSSQTNCTSTATWTSSSTSVAANPVTGLATGSAAGSAAITATSGSISGSGTLTVTGPSLTGISVTPATVSIVTGTGIQQYAAECSYSNNTNGDCTATITWSSSNPSVAGISSAGLASAVATGTTTIKADSGTVAGSGLLTVTSQTLTGIRVTPAASSLVAGTGTQQYAAQCAYSNSTSADCTSAITWSSSNPAVAVISNSGLASAVAAGTATIKAAASGSITGSGVLTVTPAVSPPVNLTRGLWSWMGGGNATPGAPKGLAGTYSTSGAASAGSVPGSRDASARWADGNGNLWLFGGGGFDSAGIDGYLNDLWVFIPSIEEWAWMGGNSTVPAANKGWPGVYGVLATPAAANAPGGREASVSWTDKAGDLWLFGGVGYDSAGTNGSLNDLWKYVPSTHEWDWIDGSSSVPAVDKGQPGVYGALGVPDAANTPGGRWGANSWTDINGNLWLFGGVGYDSTGSLGSLNDLWELNPSVNKWVWMSGSSSVGSTGGQAGAYGSFGKPAATNVPSGRSQAVSWTDGNGNLWLFGGKGFDSTGALGYLNDLWLFNPSTGEWAWVGGSSTVGCTGCGMLGIYGTLGEADLANMPGGRSQAAGWTDSNGNFWLLGGDGYDSAGTNGTLNDLWEFLPSTREWAWMAGSRTVPAANGGQLGAYGQFGVPSAANTPGGRWGAAGWTDGEGNLWLFGGDGYDSLGTYDDLNDLWVYQPSAGNLPAATPTLSVASGTYNTTQTVTIADATPGASIYYTTNGATPGTSSSMYSGPITVSTTMTLEAIALVNGYKASAVASDTYTITPSFSIAPRSGSATNVMIQPGGAAIYSLVVTPKGSTTIPTSITLTVSGIPPGSTATFTPATVAAGQGSTNVSLSVQTSSTTGSVVPRRSDWPVALCLLIFPLIGIRRWRYSGKQFLHKRLLAATLLLAGVTIALSGCADTVVLNHIGSGSGTPTPYSITVIGSSGTIQQTTTITLTVQ